MIRKAATNDLDSIARIFTEINTYEAQHTKYTAFQEGVYPTRETVAGALQEDALYVCERNGAVCACLIMNRMQPEEYADVTWRCEGPAEEVAVLQLLCVHPAKAGTGVGRAMVRFAIEEAGRLGCRALRLDTGSQNLPAVHLYESCGFSLAGTGTMSIGGRIPHRNHLFYEIGLMRER